MLACEILSPDNTILAVSFYVIITVRKAYAHHRSRTLLVGMEVTSGEMLPVKS